MVIQESVCLIQSPTIVNHLKSQIEFLLLLQQFAFNKVKFNQSGGVLNSGFNIPHGLFELFELTKMLSQHHK